MEERAWCIIGVVVSMPTTSQREEKLIRQAKRSLDHAHVRDVHSDVCVLHFWNIVSRPRSCIQNKVFSGPAAAAIRKRSEGCMASSYHQGSHRSQQLLL
jgi:hypothetical protein